MNKLMMIVVVTMMTTMMKMIMWLQEEAIALKLVTSGGVATKVIAMGIGDKVDNDELRDIASPPHDKNVIHVEGFDSLATVKEQLLDDTCGGKHCVIVVVLMSAAGFKHSLVSVDVDVFL